MVGHVVLHAPRVAREPEQRIGRPAHQVVEAAGSKVGAVIGVVHHAEGGQRRSEDQSPESDQAERQPGVAEHERRPRDEQQDERDDSLGVELDSAPGTDAGCGQVRLDLATRLAG